MSETPDMTGMENAIEQAAELLNAEGAWCGECHLEPGDPLDECPECQRILGGYARALADAGLLAPAPLTEIRAENQFGETHRRWATDWELVARAEGESWYDAEPDAMPDAGWEPIEPVDRAEGDGSAEQ